MMISSIAVGLIWRMLLHPDLGIVNYLLDEIGIGGFELVPFYDCDCDIDFVSAPAKRGEL